MYNFQTSKFTGIKISKNIKQVQPKLSLHKLTLKSNCALAIFIVIVVSKIPQIF